MFAGRRACCTPPTSQVPLLYAPPDAPLHAPPALRTCCVKPVPASMMMAHRSPQAQTEEMKRPSSKPLVTCTSRRWFDTL